MWNLAEEAKATNGENGGKARTIKTAKDADFLKSLMLAAEEEEHGGSKP